MTSALSLVPIWTVILAVGIFLYVALDGFDLGVGILYNFASTREHRNLLMNSIAPIWDGNETWLVLGSVGLFTAFPVAFTVIMPAVYFPILMMLLALIFRGLAFEFRYGDAAHRTFWDYGFAFGSALAAFAQGIVLGAFVQGFNVAGRQFAGGSFDCFTPFSFAVGLGLMVGYALLGACWLVIKTEGDLQQWARKLGRRSLVGAIIAIGVVSLWTPFLDPHIATRWFTWPNMLYLSPVPIITAALVLSVWRSLDDGSGYTPFMAALALFVMCYLGIAISLWPMIVPRHFTLYEAAASPSSQAFLLIGTLFLLPTILIYTAWSYWVFRGKVSGDVGYH
jgi:cytochrome bd ubiquinol oxidase subunit II